MTMNRREVLATGAVGAALVFMPKIAFADAVDDAISAFTGGAAVKDGGVDLDAPEIAENGNTVPVGISAAGASSIMLLAAGNPNPGVATFHFSKMVEATAKTRIRLAGTQDLIAVVKLEDGSYAKTTRAVKVTIGGCGG